MSSPVKGILLGCAAAAVVAMTLVADPQPAQAQFGISIGGLPFRFNIGPGFGSRYGRGHSRKRGKSTGDESSKSTEESTKPGKPEKVVASKGAPSSKDQTQALQKVVVTAAVRDVGSTKDLNEVGQQRTKAEDSNRDYTAKISDIIERFKKAERQARDEARKDRRGESFDTAGDVTAYAIEQSLDKAFKDAKLDQFERFVNEAWTSERLRVLILGRVLTDLPPLFDGNNRGRAPMEKLDSLIQRAAEATYRRIFETSELLAANKSSALFVQRVYQTHGAQVDNELLESTNAMLTKAYLTLTAPYDTALKRDVNGYALRYRAQRIVFDCLSEHVEKLTSSQTKIAGVDEIGYRISTMSPELCWPWLQNQFGEDGRDLKPQKPVPMRVIWSASGPRDDPSMYRGAS
jgi:hypothetical protein